FWCVTLRGGMRFVRFSGIAAPELIFGWVRRTPGRCALSLRLPCRSLLWRLLEILGRRLIANRCLLEIHWLLLLEVDRCLLLEADRWLLLKIHRLLLLHHPLICQLKIW